MIRGVIVGAALAMTASTGAGVRRANFVHIAVTSAGAASVHAIWQPCQGAATWEEQQSAVRARRSWALNPDSVRRWENRATRDTISAKTPTEFVVDMNGGPIVIEALGRDSVHVEVQLTPARGPIAASWGRAFTIDSDGRTPYVDRNR